MKNRLSISDSRIENCNNREDRLLDSNSSSNFLKLSLDLLSLILSNCFLDYLGSALNCFLSFLQAKAGDLTNNLDNLDLLSAEACQLDIKLSLLFNCLSGACSNYCNTCSCGYTKLFFASLNQLVKFHNSKLFDRIDDLSIC